jgi:hypothetical protein
MPELPEDTRKPKKNQTSAQFAEALTASFKMKQGDISQVAPA